MPGPCTDVAGSQRVLQGTRQVASFTRIQLMRAGADLMNTAYNYLDLLAEPQPVLVPSHTSFTIHVWADGYRVSEPIHIEPLIPDEKKELTVPLRRRPIPDDNTGQMSPLQ